MRHHNTNNHANVDADVHSHVDANVHRHINTFHEYITYHDYVFYTDDHGVYDCVVDFDQYTNVNGDDHQTAGIPGMLQLL